METSHNCSCHVYRNPCGICAAIKCVYHRTAVREDPVVGTVTDMKVDEHGVTFTARLAPGWTIERIEAGLKQFFWGGPDDYDLNEAAVPTIFRTVFKENTDAQEQDTDHGSNPGDGAEARRDSHGR